MSCRGAPPWSRGCGAGGESRVPIDAYAAYVAPFPLCPGLAIRRTALTCMPPPAPLNARAGHWIVMAAVGNQDKGFPPPEADLGIQDSHEAPQSSVSGGRHRRTPQRSAMAGRG